MPMPIFPSNLSSKFNASIYEASSFDVIFKTWQMDDLQDYQTCYQAMQNFTQTRVQSAERAKIADEFWLLSHPEIYTLGQAGLSEHLLRENHIPVQKVDRGGQVSYHGPGQLMVYCLIDLKRIGIYVRELVWRLEQALILTLADFGIDACRHEGAPGIYVLNSNLNNNINNNNDLNNLAKIAALGLKVSQGCCYHGLALNVNVNLKAFEDINPCGYSGLKTVDINNHLLSSNSNLNLNSDLNNNNINKAQEIIIKHLFNIIYN